MAFPGLRHFSRPLPVTQTVGKPEKGFSMSMPKGLAKATNYYNRLEAWRDWNKLATKVSNAGKSDLVEKYRPAEDAGWRKVDKAIAALREAFQQSVEPTGFTDAQIEEMDAIAESFIDEL
jgi:hypothetical protein